MKKLSIKARVTVWYTGLIVLLMIGILAFLFASGGQIVLSKAKTNLQNITFGNAEEIEYDDGVIEIDDDLKLHEKGVSIIVFQADNIIMGSHPIGFPLDVVFSQGRITTVSNQGQKWIALDVIAQDDLVVRGVYPLNEIAQSMNYILLIAFIAFPFVTAIAVIGGYLITKHAFKPITQIYQTASKIEQSLDLSQRIHLSGSTDEIYNLAKTFDCMFDRLEQSFLAEKQFTSDVSHELRTPITVIKTQCEYALLESMENENIHNALTTILAKADQMAVLVTQLLELSRAEYESKQLEFENVDVSELLEIVAEELIEQAQEKGIEIIVNTQSGILVSCEQTLMMRLLINLITNAIKYTNAGGKVTVTLQEEQRNVVIYVTDTGIGIAKENLSAIFHRFYKVDSSRSKEEQHSFGLGLALCKWIVESHAGSIQVQSEMNKGSTFIVRLPKI